MSVAVITAATKRFSYALYGSIMSVKRAMAGVPYTHILATDKSGVAEKIIKSTGVNAITLELDVDDESLKYKEESQIVIARLQQACLDQAVALDADLCWSVESDMLVHPDSFRGLRWTLDCPTPTYDIAVSTYWNGSFLCGRGTEKKQICEDYTEEERELPEELKKQLEEKRASWTACVEKKEKPSEELLKELRELDEKVKQCPPKGNVFSLNAVKWRKRGWLDQAYPGAAVHGAVLPTDWCGMGCTLLSKKALAVSNFDGYDGKGTQDLYLVWNRWSPAGLKIACNISVPASHVKKGEDGYVVHQPYFSPQDEETSGHIRVYPRKYCELTTYSSSQLAP
jgi:hypothetical protein